jgi:hypothetical protein
MDLNKYTRDELILGGVALLLAIDLLFLPWFEVSVRFGSLTLSASSTGTESPDGWLGVLGAIASLALLARGAGGPGRAGAHGLPRSRALHER